MAWALWQGICGAGEWRTVCDSTVDKAEGGRGVARRGEGGFLVDKKRGGGEEGVGRDEGEDEGGGGGRWWWWGWSRMLIPTSSLEDFSFRADPYLLLWTLQTRTGDRRLNSTDPAGSGGLCALPAHAASLHDQCLLHPGAHLLTMIFTGTSFFNLHNSDRTPCPHAFPFPVSSSPCSGAKWEQNSLPAHTLRRQ